MWYNKYLFLDTENIYIHNALAVQAYSVYVHGSNAHRQESAVNELIKQEALIQVIFNEEKKTKLIIWPLGPFYLLFDNTHFPKVRKNIKGSKFCGSSRGLVQKIDTPSKK